jgi:hypothetical protein
LRHLPAPDATRREPPRGLVSLAVSVAAISLIARACQIELTRYADAPSLWHDEAVVGLTGLAVLQGLFPIYFFGQPFMGALDAYLTAPVFLVLGASTLTLRLVALLVYLTWMSLVVCLAWRWQGRRAAAWTTLLLAVPPGYLLHWSLEARPHYTLGMTLGTLALLMAVSPAGTARWPVTARLALLGAVLGLAFWTNFLSAVFVPGVAVVLVRRYRWRALASGIAIAPAFVLGSLPHWGYALRQHAIVPAVGAQIQLDVDGLASFWQAWWPMIAGVPPAWRGTTAGLALALGLGVTYAVACGATIRRIGRGACRRPDVGLALLAVLATNLFVVIATRRGHRLVDDARYLLPLYTALPVLLGQWLSRLSPGWVGAGVGGALVLVHAVIALPQLGRGFLPSAHAEARARQRPEQETIASLQQAGLTRLYGPSQSTRVLTFLSTEQVIFSHPYQEALPRHARAVDGASTIGWWFSEPSPAFEATLTALGARFEYRRVGAGGIYTSFALEPRALRQLDPAAFRVTASERADTAGRITDQDIGTLWRTARAAAGGEWVQVDLGRTEPVTMVRWLPGRHQEAPRGLVLEASLDGLAWTPLVQVPEYLGPLYWSAGRPMARVRSGRIELRTPPTAARHLRIVQTGRDTRWSWSIRELWVYAAAEDHAIGAPRADAATLARTLRQAGVARLYADHGWGSRVALADPGIEVLPANLQLDEYGLEGSPETFVPAFRWVPGCGVLLEPEDAQAFAIAARASGLGFTQEPVEGLVLFGYAPSPAPGGTPLPPSRLVASASREARRGPLAIDGSPGTRWTTARPQAPGDWFRVDLTEPRVVRAVRVWTAHPTDWPRGLSLEGSADGVTWHPVPSETRREGRLVWGGLGLLQDGVRAVRLDFEPVRLQALRLTLTRGDGVFDWSIHDLTVYTPG